MNIYLIKRGKRPSYHRAPFHPVIICDRKAVARQESGDSGAGAWVWEQWGAKDELLCGGWLLSRWNGFDIDYGGIVHNITMPDGSHSAFYHERDKPPWTLIRSAVWWSVNPMPDKLQAAGVIYPPDKFTRNWIMDECLPIGKPPRRKKGEPKPDIEMWVEAYGFDRIQEWPTFWPPTKPEQENR